MTLGLAVDAALAVLLVVTIGYCAAVHRRLGAIRTAQADMRALAEELSAATVRAETGLDQLRAAAQEATDNLAPRIRTARALAGDLDMLCHRAGRLAERLAGPARRGLRSQSEHALIEALKGNR